MTGTRSWKPRDLKSLRSLLGNRDTNRTRNIQSPSVPTGIQRKGAPQKMIFPRPSNSRRSRDFEKWKKYKKKLMDRYDVDERNRRKDLTLNQHTSPTGKIGSEGFRKYTTVTGNTYKRDRSPHNGYEGKKRQYAYPLEFEQTAKYHVTKHMGPFGNKRYKYSMKRKQPRNSGVA